MNNNELFPVINEQGEVIGKATRLECHSGSKLLHPVVHLHIFNARGELYLQKRSLNKDIQPGKWDTAVGGHIDYGEDVHHALLREAREELDFTNFTPHHLFSYIFESDREREMINAFVTTTTLDSFAYDPEEVDDGKFWSLQEINDAIGKGILTPNFEMEFAKLSLALSENPHLLL